MLVRRAAAGSLALALAVAHGCGADDRAPPAGGSGGSSSDGGGSGGTGVVWGGGSSGLGAAGGAGGSGGVAGCGGPAPAYDGPPDWELFTGYCGCPMWVPGAKGQLPDPVEWEPCPSPGPMNLSCRRMKTPWTKAKTLSINVFPKFWFDAKEDRALLLFARIYLNDKLGSAYLLAAEADGPIGNVFYLQSLTCGFDVQSINEGKFAIASRPVAMPQPGLKEAALAGDVSGLPETTEYPVESLYANFGVSSSWLIRWGDVLTGRRWGSDEVVVLHKSGSDPEGEPPQRPRAVGDAVFWEIGGLKKHGVVAWTEATGQQNLIRWLGDYTQGAGNFNTDGMHMIWTHAEGKAPNDESYPKRSIMTAPFTTDPAVRKATEKRLRSDPGQLSVSPFGIGCGYAAREYYTIDSTELLVVRLSDGVSWIVKAPPFSTGVQFMSVLGLTCEDVFAQVQFPDEVNAIVRIRLDSLGPGIVPD